jgi:uncharacterized Rossmann fold enzyme
LRGFKQCDTAGNGKTKNAGSHDDNYTSTTTAADATATVSMEHNVRVDLDITDFGHAVGEVELVVHKQEDIPTARQSFAISCKNY